MGIACLAKEWADSAFHCKIDKTAKIWEPTTILKEHRNIDIGARCRIGQYCFIAPKTLRMDEGAEISPLAVLGGGGDIYMCKFSTVDYGAKLIPATFTTNGEYMNDAMAEIDESKVETVRGTIVLEEGVVVASNAVVTVSKKHRNIVIGENSVVGALTFVDRSVPPNTVLLGDVMRQRVR